MSDNTKASDLLANDQRALRDCLDLIDTNVMVCDCGMNIVYANKKVLDMFRNSEDSIREDYPEFSVDTLVGSNLSNYHVSDQPAQVLIDISATFTSVIRFGGENFRIVVNPLHGDGGHRVGSVVEWQNLTARRRRREEDRLRRERIESILDGIGEMRIAVDGDGFIRDVNEQALDRLGYEKDELVGVPLDRLVPAGITVDMLADLAFEGVVQGMQTAFRRVDGQYISVNLSGFVHAMDSATRGRLTLLARPVQANAEKDSVIQLSEFLADRISDGVAVVDAEWRVLSVNRPFREIIDCDAGRLIGTTLTELMPDVSDFQTRPEDASWEREYCFTRGDNSEFTIILSVYALDHGCAERPNRLVTIRDVSGIKESERRMRELAYTDQLTGLANRMYCEQRIRESIKMAKRSGQRLALLFLDLDCFKDVNDSLGHAAGDRLLRTVADRLRAFVRETDLVARLGGDEFCVLLLDVSAVEDVARIADGCLKDLAAPCVIGERELHPTASIGIALFPEDGKTASELLRAADTAMYASKRNDSERRTFYSPEMTRAAQHRLSIEQGLRAAFRKEEFVVHYQPQVALNTGRVTGSEALVRWNHPELGIVPPDEFIPILEKLKLIEELGEYVLRTTCRQAVVWARECPTPLRVGINISGLHFQSGRIVEHVAAVLEETGVDPALVELEVTESIIQTGESTLETCLKLKELGVTLALDDFGTGFSCLDSMRQLPLDCLKIDRLFVRDLVTESGSASIVATIVAMSRAMGLKIVAEGVEDMRQVQYLSGLGCETGQGYYFSRPVEAGEIPAIAARTFLPQSGSDASIAPRREAL